VIYVIGEEVGLQRDTTHKHVYDQAVITVPGVSRGAGGKRNSGNRQEEQDHEKLTWLAIGGSGSPHLLFRTGDRDSESSSPLEWRICHGAACRAGGREAGGREAGRVSRRAVFGPGSGDECSGESD